MSFVAVAQERGCTSVQACCILAEVTDAQVDTVSPARLATLVFTLFLFPVLLVACLWFLIPYPHRR